MIKIKTKIKMFFLLTFIFFSCLPLSPIRVKAATNRVDTDDITAVIEEDGDVRVTEVIHGTFKEGSENYLVKLRGTGIENYTVSMDGKAFTYDPSAPWGFAGDYLEWKSYKYGFYYDNDVELCWGISAYGEHTYTVQYTMKGLAHTYGEDGDGFNIRFFNDKWDNGPTDVTVKIYVEGMTLTDNNSSIWSFGFHGKQWYENGVACVDAPHIGRSNYVTVMMSLEPGSLMDASKDTRSWQQVYSQAIEDSDYQKTKTVINILFEILKCFLTFGWIIVVIVIFAIVNARKKAARKKLLAETLPYHDIPLNGDLGLIASIWQTMDFPDCDEEDVIPNLIRAYMLRMVYKGYIATYNDDSGTGFRLIKSPEETGNPEDRVMRNLYELLENGNFSSENGLITNKTMRKREFGEEIYALGNSMSSNGMVRAYQAGILPKSYFHGRKKYSPRTNSSEFRNAVSQVVGFYKYMTDSTLMNERRSQEVIVWKQYMVVATVLGIADKVEDEFKMVAPKEEYVSYNSFYHCYHSSVDHSYSSTYSDYHSSSSDSSSIGGGGGSSGGGSGGGSR